MTDFLDIVCIHGEKIDLCCLRTDEESIKFYTKCANDEYINAWIGLHNRVTQYIQEKEWAEKKRKDGDNIWSIVEKNTRKLLGTCTLDFTDRITATLGIYIGEETGRNHGFGTECIKLLIDTAFGQMNAHRVSLKVIAGNKRAYNCYLNAGLKECGVMHEAVYYNGHYDDLIVMELMQEDWRKNKDINVADMKVEY